MEAYELKLYVYCDLLSSGSFMNIGISRSSNIRFFGRFARFWFATWFMFDPGDKPRFCSSGPVRFAAARDAVRAVMRGRWSQHAVHRGHPVSAQCETGGCC